QLHDFCNFRGVGFRERSAKDGEVLRKNVNQPSIDVAKSTNESIARWPLLGHSKIRAAMLHKFIQLLKRAFVEKKRNPLTRIQLAFFMLAPAALCSAPGFRFFVAKREFIDCVVF